MAWLIDKSAFVRLRTHPNRLAWFEIIDRGLVSISTVTKLEVGFSAVNLATWEAVLENPPISEIPWLLLTPAIERRAVQVQGLLAASGHHRVPSIPDLLIAATAELNNLRVLAEDKDFKIIADITGQRIDDLDAVE
jgi:predicted nucleic acid-binding protein